MVENKLEKLNSLTVEQILGSQVLRILYEKGICLVIEPDGTINGSIQSNTPSTDYLINITINDVKISSAGFIKGETDEGKMI